jgi:TetR/AcrR family transcriptional repressor of nem operon
MGHSRAEKAKTHERIVALASKRFREKGLVAQALGSAVGPWKGLVDAAASGGPPVTYDSLVDAKVLKLTYDRSYSTISIKPVVI